MKPIFISSINLISHRDRENTSQLITTSNLVINPLTTLFRRYSQFTNCHFLHFTRREPISRGGKFKKREQQQQQQFRQLHRIFRFFFSFLLLTSENRVQRRNYNNGDDDDALRSSPSTITESVAEKKGK